MTATRTVRIGSSHGLHARPAKIFAQAAKDSGLAVTIAKDSGKPVNAASILGVSRSTLDRWTQEGVVRAIQGARHRWRRYELTELARVKAQNRAISDKAIMAAITAKPFDMVFNIIML